MEQFSQDALIHADTALRLRLVLEELLTNSLNHAQCCLVKISLVIGENGVKVEYRDSSPPFNPLDHIPTHHLENDPENRPVGGLGCLLVFSMTRDAIYSRSDGLNLLVFTVP